MNEISKLYKMAFLPYIVLVALLGVAASQPNRIVGGEPTTIEEYPSIVQVEFNLVGWSQNCAGNVLNEVYILSAAHCFAGILYHINWRRIRAGATDRNTNEGVVIGLQAVLNHPSYGVFSTHDGDISLIRLQSALPFNSKIQPIAIPPQNSEIPDNSPVVHAGWGTIFSNGPSSPVLLDVTVYTVNRELCTSRYAERNLVVTENMICVGILDVGGKDACQGDSGGPLYYGNVLAGVVAWGRGCADAYYPGVNTRVASYTNWIVENAV